MVTGMTGWVTVGSMARPVGDEHFARPGAAEGEREPDPPDLAEAANRAEDDARRAVEGIGIEAHPPDRP